MTATYHPALCVKSPLHQFLATLVTTKAAKLMPINHPELKDQNIAVSIIVSVIIISVSMIVKDSMLLLLEALMPYPDYPLVL